MSAIQAFRKLCGKRILIQFQRTFNHNNLNTLVHVFQAAWELRAVSCIDLTTLSGDDTLANVNRLCFKAKHPVRYDLLKAMEVEDLGMYGVLLGLLMSIYPFSNNKF